MTQPHIHRPIPPAIQYGFNHVEAFNLMYYENEETGLGFLVFNPRNGVTPFNCFLEGKEYLHQHFGLDRFLPNFQPPAGMRIFRDRTAVEARETAERRVALFNGTEHEVAEEDRERVIASMTDNYLRVPMLDMVPQTSSK